LLLDSPARLWLDIADSQFEPTALREIVRPLETPTSRRWRRWRRSSRDPRGRASL